MIRVHVVQAKNLKTAVANKKFFVTFVEGGIFLLLFLFSQVCFGKKGVDPFEKITVQSESALFERELLDKSSFRLEYSGNVRVTLADETSITSKTLEIFLSAGKKGPEGFSGGVEIKKIIFRKNVLIDDKSRKISASCAELIVPEKLCTLNGNVKIEQSNVEGGAFVKGDTLKDGETVSRGESIPFVTECDRAQIEWDTKKIFFEGAKHKPVNTTIELGGKLRSKISKKK